MIELKNVTFFYENKKILDNINIKISRNEKIVIFGVNGSGKTTLLKILNGLLFPNYGQYFYKGEEISEKKLKNRNFSKKFRKEVVLLFQNPDTMLFNPTVYDEIAFGLRQLNIKNIDERVYFWAKKLDIDKYLDQSPFDLSGGEKQKVCLASLLVLEPEVLLLDEPTAYLDPYTTGWLLEFLSDLDITIVTTTHNLSIARDLGKRGVVLNKNGQIIYDGSLEELLQNMELLKKARLIYKNLF